MSAPVGAKCTERINTLKAEAALPGAPTYEKARVHMARVRGRAALWRKALERPPRLTEVLDKNDTAPKVATALRNRIKKTESREARRKLLLRDGYLWDDDVRMALALVEQVSLPNLFREKTLFLQRGVDTYELERVPKTRYLKERYLYKDGPLAGERAEILFGDRVATERATLTPETSLGVDLRDVMDRYPVDRLRPEHLTDKHLVMSVRYGPGTWVPAVFELAGPARHARLRCAHRRAGRCAHQVRSAARGVAPSHAPHSRRGATDGEGGAAVRRRHRADDGVSAPKRGRVPTSRAGASSSMRTRAAACTTTTATRDRRRCASIFLTDTWERASGTWYAPADKLPSEKEGKFRLEPKPKRTEGGIDFDRLEIENRRSVAKFTEFTEGNKELFDVWALPKDKRFPFRDRERFFGYLAESADNFQPGDMITLHGYKDGGRPHYHSLIVLEQDPITGVITRVAGNAVFPREQTLEGIMYISPKRSIRHRIRVKEPWLKLIARGADDGERGDATPR